MTAYEVVTIALKLAECKVGGLPTIYPEDVDIREAIRLLVGAQREINLYESGQIQTSLTEPEKRKHL